MINKLTFALLVSLTFACSDQVVDDEKGWKFRVPQPDTSRDIAPDKTADSRPSEDVRTPDIVEKDMERDEGMVDFGTEDVLVLSDVRYSDLPAGAIRSALSGFDPIDNVCVALIVEFTTEYCFLESDTPAHLFIKENATDSNCWDYIGNAVNTNASGCVQFHTPPLSNDIELTVESENYNKTVRFF